MIARTIEGSIWWGVAAAIDGWSNIESRDKRKRRRITDGELVEALQTGSWTADQAYAFAREYSVHQVYLNENKSGRRPARLAEVATFLRVTYGGRPVGSTAELAALWIEAVDGLQDIIERYNQGARPRLTSFAMKSLWYYQPERSTMWDSYAVAALKHVTGMHHSEHIGTANEAEAFLADFDKLYETNAALIETAITEVGEHLAFIYPYPRRVLDKALWLIGKSLDTSLTKAGVRKCDTIADDFNALLYEWNPGLREATQRRFELNG